MALILITLTLYAVVAIVGLRVALRATDRLALLPVLAMIGNETIWHFAGSSSLISLHSSDNVYKTGVGNLLDFTYMICWAVGFLFIYAISRSMYKHQAYQNLVRQYPGRPLVHRDTNYYLYRLRPILYVVAACVLLYFPIAAVLNWPTGYAWGWQEDVAVPYPLLYVFFKIIIEVAPGVGCAWIILRGEKVLSKKNIIALVAVIGYALVWGLARGVRGRFIAPFVLLLLSAYVVRRGVRKLALIVVVSVVLIIVLSPAIERMRKTEQFGRGTGVFGRIRTLLSGGGDETGFFANLGRMNIGYWTGLTYVETNRRGHVGHKPYRAVPFVFVPRPFYHNKPVYGSIDDTRWGILWYLTDWWAGGPAERAASQTLGPAAQPYWVAGWGGVFGIGLLGGLLVGLVWYRWRLAYHPLGLAILFSVMVVGVEFSRLYYDVSWPLKDFIQKGGLLVIMYLMARVFCTRQRRVVTQTQLIGG